MINYEEFKDNADFMEILDYLRVNCLASEDEVSDGLDMEYDVVSKHFSLAQAIIAEEVENGIIHDEEGIEIVSNFIDFLTK